MGLRCCARAFSSCGKQGLLFIAPCGLLIAVASHCRAWALGVQASVVVARGLSSCGSWALEPQLAGLLSLQHVGSSRTKARTRVPFIGRQILNHCATREAPVLGVFIYIISFSPHDNPTRDYQFFIREDYESHRSHSLKSKVLVQSHTEFQELGPQSVN